MCRYGRVVVVVVKRSFLFAADLTKHETLRLTPEHAFLLLFDCWLLAGAERWMVPSAFGGQVILTKSKLEELVRSHK